MWGDGRGGGATQSNWSLEFFLRLVLHPKRVGTQVKETEKEGEGVGDSG